MSWQVYDCEFGDLDALVNLRSRLWACSVETADCIFIFGSVLVSALPYLPRLGFYSDDWTYQSTLASVSGQSLAATFKALLASDSNLLIRPVQAAFLAIEFKAFGRHAMPYHIGSTVFLGIATVLLYLVLEEMRVGRVRALAIAHWYSDCCRTIRRIGYGSPHNRQCFPWFLLCLGFMRFSDLFGRSSADLRAGRFLASSH